MENNEKMISLNNNNTIDTIDIEANRQIILPPINPPHNLLFLTKGIAFGYEKQINGPIIDMKEINTDNMPKSSGEYNREINGVVTIPITRPMDSVENNFKKFLDMFFCGLFSILLIIG